eukprot:10429593-Karenia_brevis.AAC.1
MDLLINKWDCDIINDKVWEEVLENLGSGAYDILLVTPPCNTYSRAVFANRRGPEPFRNQDHPF